ncbi:F0F1 ATP synthase subunit delta [Endomicrobium proavitum]|uniref:Putative F0F1-type ATPase delta subunit n=1 Tax=Endomicrobium proavitum TaxID=1408281 RepID=A0A0G3WJB6_9BACT|nr:F0F1 ATP synthase subunit delta [Endomicrobium proavitum]AKL97945.1 putative F0F1-type ATPase delta subunit [Endomicrobium proavitum]
MKRTQIKELAKAVVESGELSENNLQRVFSLFQRKDLKLFSMFLAREIKDKNANVNFAGEISEENKKRISALFANKNISYKRDDENIIAGVRFEYGDFIMDYSVAGIIKRMLDSVKENI